MDAQRFLAEFGHIANAPEGIARLRELILQLAISGRLVEPSNIGETVEESISAALKLKIEYEEKFKIRPTGLHSLIDSEPFTIPNHWQWARLHQLALYIQRGKGPKYSDSGSAYVVSQKCIQWSGFDLQQAKFISDESLNTYSEERFLCNDDLLWNSTGTGTAGRIAIYRQTDGKRAVADSHVTVIRLANFFPRYIWCVIASPWIQARIEPAHSDSLVSGTTQQVELATSTARALPIPCPPIEEQSRIVAKVDELMVLCDKLEAQQQQRRTLQNRLRQATLQGLAAAANPNELQGTWMRLEENFSRLFQEPEDVNDLRCLIFDLAVKGLLTIQDPNDEPAIVLLKKITLEKGESGTVSKKRKFEVEKIDEKNKPYELPVGWLWCSLEQVSNIIQYGYTASASNKSGTCQFLRITDIQNDQVNWESVPMCVISENEIPKYQLQNGDIVIARTGGTIGKSYLICGLKRVSIFASYLIRIGRLKSNLPDYTKIFLGSSVYWSQLSEKSMGTGQPNVSGSSLKSLMFPLPPIEEQRRIAKRVSELLVLCNTWETQLRSSNAQVDRYAASAVTSFAGIPFNQEQNQPMKSPKTQLIAPLRLGTPPTVKEPAPLASILAHHHGEMQAKDLWQRFGGEIDAFYARLKLEVEKGWILEPQPAEMRQTETA